MINRLEMPDVATQVDISLVRIPALAAELVASVIRVPLVAIQLASSLAAVPFVAAQMASNLLGHSVARVDNRVDEFLQDRLTSLSSRPAYRAGGIPRSPVPQRPPMPAYQREPAAPGQMRSAA